MLPEGPRERACRLESQVGGSIERPMPSNVRSLRHVAWQVSKNVEISASWEARKEVNGCWALPFSNSPKLKASLKSPT